MHGSIETSPHFSIQETKAPKSKSSRGFLDDSLSSLLSDDGLSLDRYCTVMHSPLSNMISNAVQCHKHKAETISGAMLGQNNFIVILMFLYFICLCSCLLQYSMSDQGLCMHVANGAALIVVWFSGIQAPVLSVLLEFWWFKLGEGQSGHLPLAQCYVAAPWRVFFTLHFRTFAWLVAEWIGGWVVYLWDWVDSGWGRALWYYSQCLNHLLCLTAHRNDCTILMGGMVVQSSRLGKIIFIFWCVFRKFHARHAQWLRTF